MNKGLTSNTTFTPTSSEGRTCEDIEAIRAAVVGEVNALFAKVQYDERGYAVNDVCGYSEIEYFSYPGVDSCRAFFTGQRSITLKIGSTLRDLEDQLEAHKQTKAIAVSEG